jgi:hypothetical protein
MTTLRSTTPPLQHVAAQGAAVSRVPSPLRKVRHAGGGAGKRSEAGAVSGRLCCMQGRECPRRGAAGGLVAGSRRVWKVHSSQAVRSSRSRTGCWGGQRGARLRMRKVGLLARWSMNVSPGWPSPSIRRRLLRVTVSLRRRGREWQQLSLSSGVKHFKKEAESWASALAVMWR